jgi:hypothetical protein
MDVDSGEEVASLAGRFEPATFAAAIDSVGEWYNRAGVMVERANHGHAVLLWLKDNSKLPRLNGHDNAPGWLTSTKGKAMLFDQTGENLRDGKTIIHDAATFDELASIEGSTLSAPKGQADDLAIGFACAVVGRRTPAPAPLIPEPELLASRKAMRSPFPKDFFEQANKRNAERLRGQAS